MQVSGKSGLRATEISLFGRTRNSPVRVCRLPDARDRLHNQQDSPHCIYGGPAPTLSIDLIRMGVVWRLQERKLGGLGRH